MTLLRVILRRLASVVPLMLLVSLIVFSIPYFIPGDPAFTIAGPTATAQELEEIRQELGFNEPVLAQYFVWLRDVVRLDLGESFIVGRSVRTMVAERMEVTFSIAGLGTLFAAVVGIPLGLIAATGIGKLRDRSAVILSSLGVAIPNYWLAALLVTYIAVGLRWFPAAGYVRFSESPSQWLHHMVLPMISVGAIAAAEVTRQTRARVAEVMKLDYVRTARAKGLPPPVVFIKHAFKNGAIPVVTVIGLTLTVSLGGAVIIERIFGMAGLGDLAITAVQSRDIPVLQAIVLFTTVIAVSANLVVDIVASYLDPRVGLS